MRRDLRPSPSADGVVCSLQQQHQPSVKVIQCMSSQRSRLRLLRLCSWWRLHQHSVARFVMGIAAATFAFLGLVFRVGFFVSDFIVLGMFMLLGFSALGAIYFGLGLHRS